MFYAYCVYNPYIYILYDGSLRSAVISREIPSSILNKVVVSIVHADSLSLSAGTMMTKIGSRRVSMWTALEHLIF